jgi:hypothetical protein
MVKMKKENELQILKLRNTQNFGSVNAAQVRKARKVKLKKKQKVSNAIKFQLLKNYGFKIEGN